jgi:peptidoglycan/xylan/chitin deacetylase (PgdA/CDA1 family)
MRFNILLALLLLCLPHLAQAQISLPEDKTAARILAYFMVGRDEMPEANVTIEQFQSHLDLLKDGDYHVANLSDVTKSYKQGTILPEKTVVITFDGGDKSILTNAIPLLERYNFPYTIFIATDRASANDPRWLNWSDIQKLQKSNLMSVGLHPDIYGSIGHQNPVSIRSRINNATARLRNEISVNAQFFAYPFGDYTATYKDVLTDYGFALTFGQQSGVAHKGAIGSPLPRFTMTENYADLDRFKMVINSLPLAASEITPEASHINTANPSIGFTVPEAITSELHRLSCFTSGQDKPKKSIIGNRVELRLAAASTQDRFRVNCTLPVKSKREEKTSTWRWLGFLFKFNEPTKKSL